MKIQVMEFFLPSSPHFHLILHATKKFGLVGSVTLACNLWWASRKFRTENPEM